MQRILHIRREYDESMNLRIYFSTEIFPPVVDLRGQLEANEGDIVMFHCDVKSNPPSQIVWYKDDRELKVEDKNFLRVAEQCQSLKNGYYFKLMNGQKTFSYLIICEVNLEKNSGTYICKAQNQLGNGSSSATLDIFSK